MEWAQAQEQENRFPPRERKEVLKEQQKQPQQRTDLTVTCLCFGLEFLQLRVPMKLFLGGFVFFFKLINLREWVI